MPLIGFKHSKETKIKMRESHSGTHHSAETIRKMCIAQKGENHPMFNKHHTEKTKMKMSISRTGEKNPNYGKHFSEEHKRKISISSKGKTHSEETKRKIAIATKGKNNPMYGRRHSQETLKKMRLAQQGKKLSEERKSKMGIKGEKSPRWIDGLSVSDINKYQRRWGARNPFKVKAGTYRRKSLMEKAGILTIQTIQQVYEDNIKKYGTLTCYLCLKPIEFKKDCLEHKTPLSRNGTNKYENLAVAHGSCNNKKHSKTEEEYRKEVLLENTFKIA